MSKGLTPGAVLPDFILPDDTGTMRRLSQLQGRTKADFDPTSAQARAAWQAPMPAGAGAAGHA
jgi:hypothetical protein